MTDPMQDAVVARCDPRRLELDRGASRAFRIAIHDRITTPTILRARYVPEATQRDPLARFGPRFGEPVQMRDPGAAATCGRCTTKLSGPC